MKKKSTLASTKSNCIDILICVSKEVLEMATVNGAKALAMEKLIGSIEPAKREEIIIVNLCDPRFTPVLFRNYPNLQPCLHAQNLK